MIRLTVHDYSLLCHLGCSAAERAQKQEVRVSLQIDFAEKPQACVTDNLSDTVCYDQLCRLILKTTQTVEFQTIEHLAHKLHENLRASLKRALKWNLSLHKVSPPIDGLRGGVTFQIEQSQ